MSSSKITPKPVIWFLNNERKKMNPKLFLDTAEKIAQEILDAKVERDKSMSSTQIRRYYSEVKALDYRVKGWRHLPPEEQEAKFAEILPLVKIMRAKVEYKRNAKSGKISQPFAQFMADCIHSVNNLEEFNAFILYFEAVMGFYVGRNSKES